MNRDRKSGSGGIGTGNQGNTRTDKGNSPDLNLDRINRLRAELRRKESLLDACLEMAHKMFSQPDIVRICRLLCMALSGRLGVEKSAVYLSPGDCGGFKLRHELGSGTEPAPETINPAGGFKRWLDNRDIPAYMDDYYRSRGGIGKGEEGWMEGLIRAGYSWAAPLRSDGEVLGLALLGGKAGKRDLKDPDPELLSVIVAIGSSAAAGALSISESTVDHSGGLDFARFKEEELARRSFELDTPLTVLKSTLWSVESGTPGGDLMIDMARDALVSLQKQITELASIAELKFRGTELNLSRTDISDLINDSLRKFIPEIEQKSVSVDYSEKIHREVMADPEKMELAFTALIERMVKQLRPAGRLEIINSVSETGPGREEGAEIRGWDNGGMKEAGKVADPLDRELADIGAGGWVTIRILADTENPNLPESLISGRGSYGNAEDGPLMTAQKIISEHGGGVFLNTAADGRAVISIWLPALF
ncbi:MAG: hypothetical protein R6U43_11860 [Candidatus Krumholzibacteriales bacterium]